MILTLFAILILISVALLQNYYHTQTHKEFIEYKIQTHKDYLNLKTKLDGVKEELDTILEEQKKLEKANASDNISSSNRLYADYMEDDSFQT